MKLQTPSSLLSFRGGAGIPSASCLSVSGTVNISIALSPNPLLSLPPLQFGFHFAFFNVIEILRALEKSSPLHLKKKMINYTFGSDPFSGM